MPRTYLRKTELLEGIAMGFVCLASLLLWVCFLFLFFHLLNVMWYEESRGQAWDNCNFDINYPFVTHCTLHTHDKLQTDLHSIHNLILVELRWPCFSRRRSSSAGSCSVFETVWCSSIASWKSTHAIQTVSGSKLSIWWMPWWSWSTFEIVGGIHCVGWINSERFFFRVHNRDLQFHVLGVSIPIGSSAALHSCKLQMFLSDCSMVTWWQVYKLRSSQGVNVLLLYIIITHCNTVWQQHLLTVIECLRVCIGCNLYCKQCKVRIAERSVEGRHSVIHRIQRRAPRASTPYLSLEMRLPYLRRLASTSPECLQGMQDSLVKLETTKGMIQAIV